MNKALSGMAIAGTLLLAVLPAQAGELGSDQLKDLVTGKTVHVTHAGSGKTWKLYHDPSGTAYNSDGSESEWNITSDGKHCNTGKGLKCAKVIDNGDGTYNRVKPNGKTAVIWTAIVDGKDF